MGDIIVLIANIKRGMLMIWVINSNSNTCRIYQYNKPNAKLALIKEILHPENRLHNYDLTSDGPGRYRASGGGHGSFVPSDPKDVHIDNFMRDVARELNTERAKHSFEKLILISPSHTNGLLMQHMDKHVKDLIITTIQKDLLHLNEQDLLSVLDSTPNY
jgi:protein required for attachment to host cells